MSVDGPDSHSEDGSDVASEDLAADYNTVSESVHNAKGFETLNLFEDRCDSESEMERPKRIISPQDLDGDSDTDIIPRKRFKNTVDDDSDYWFDRLNDVLNM